MVKLCSLATNRHIFTFRRLGGNGSFRLHRGFTAGLFCGLDRTVLLDRPLIIGLFSQHMCGNETPETDVSKRIDVIDADGGQAVTAKQGNHTGYGTDGADQTEFTTHNQKRPAQPVPHGSEDEPDCEHEQGNRKTVHSQIEDDVTGDTVGSVPDLLQDFTQVEFIDTVFHIEPALFVSPFHSTHRQLT